MPPAKKKTVKKSPPRRKAAAKPPAAPRLVLLTRNEAADDSMARRAERAGYAVARLALFTTEAGQDTGTLLRLLDTVDPSTALAWTSRRAGEALTGAVLPRHREILNRIPLFAVGEESASPMASRGFRISTPPAAAGAKELARWILDQTKASGVSRVVFLRGNRALPHLKQDLESAGVRVEALEVYQTRPLSVDVSPVLKALHGGALAYAVFFSPSGIDALERLLDGPSRTRLRQTVHAVARGGTTLQALKDRGYVKASAPTGPAESTMALEAFVSGLLNKA